MLIKLNTFLIFLFFSLAVLAQKDEVLFTINGKKFLKKEFITTCENEKGANWKSFPDSLKNYLDEFIDFKMKVIEAKSLGLDLSDKFKEDINVFEKQLFTKYLTDKETLNFYVAQTYERSKTEVWIRHILLRVDPQASAKDTLYAYQKALNIRKKLLAGGDFNQIASQISDDPSAAVNGGDQWYVKPLQIPLAVENYIYSNIVEKLSMPIRSKYGYHIIEIMGKRPNPGKFKVSHILISKLFDDKDTSEILLKQKADSIYQLAINGGDFAQLAKKYSCDLGTSSTGGELPWFETGKMPREFEEATLKLKFDGAISKPVKTNFGWHIIKRISHEDNQPFEQIKEQLFNMVLTSEKGQIALKKNIEKLKKDYKFNDFSALTPFYSYVDSTIFEGNWVVPPFADLSSPMFSIGTRNFDQSDFANFLQNNQKRNYPIPILNYVNCKYEEFIDSSIVVYASKNMENKYPQFATTLNNFKEKILAGYLLDEILFEKAENDEIGLNNFYKKNTTNYNKSYIADVCIFSYNPEKSNKIEKQFNKIKEDNLSGQDLENNIRINADNEFTLTKCGKFKEGDETHVDECIKLYKAGNINKEHRLIFFEAHKLLLILNEEIKINEKSLDEVRNSVVADYRTYLENNFVKDLKQKYSVVINQDIFESIKN